MPSPRPYRLWDVQAKCDMRGRYYAHSKNAHHAAMNFCDKWAPIGRSIQVYNADTGKELETYTRRISGVHWGDKNARTLDSAATRKVRSYNGQEAQAAD